MNDNICQCGHTQSDHINDRDLCTVDGCMCCWYKERMSKLTEEQAEAWSRRQKKLNDRMLELLLRGKEEDVGNYLHAESHLYICHKCGSQGNYSELLCPFGIDPSYDCTCVTDCPFCYKEGEEQ